MQAAEITMVSWRRFRYPRNGRLKMAALHGRMVFIFSFSAGARDIVSSE
jgi:hypothetical protein